MKHKSEMENINLIRRVAWNFHRRFQQYEIDDLIQEAALGYLKGLRTYSPEKGSITTHTWNSMHSQLYNYLRKEREYHTPLCDLESAECVPTPYHDIWERLPFDVQTVTTIIFENVAEYDSLTPEEARFTFRLAQYVQQGNVSVRERLRVLYTECILTRLLRT
jgi:RNA polymerase sigma factor (sigma-70 family)